MFTKLTICAVGKSSKEYLPLEEHYTKLIATKLDVKITTPLSHLPQEQQINLESKELINKSSGFIIALDSSGQQLDSITFANKMREWSTNEKNISFLIGGSHGLSNEVKKLVKFKLSFSAMTIPHQLAKIFLLEQIYRAETIIAGRSYHK